jgi:hypothetical protein
MQANIQVNNIETDTPKIAGEEKKLGKTSRSCFQMAIRRESIALYVS